MNQQIEYKCPFDIYRKDAEFINNEPSLTHGIKNYLRAVCALTCPPQNWEHIATAESIIGKLKLVEATPLQNIDIELMDNFLQANSCHSASSYSAQEYPTFTALEKLSNKEWSSSKVRYFSLYLYVSMFKLEALDQTKLDPYIFYLDAYFCRDVFLYHLDDFTFSKDDLSSLHNFKAEMVKQCPDIVSKRTSNEATKSSKFSRLLEMLTGERSPGERQKRKSSRTSTTRIIDIETVPPSPSTANDGAGYEANYPDEDNLEDPVSYTRKTPAEGSKLSYVDDKKAIHGRANSQAARNVVSISDTHRLPLPCISAYFAYLVSTDLYFLAYFWILVTTGIQPSRLTELKITSAKRSKNHKGCHLDIETGILSYEIINRSNDKKNQLMMLVINKEVINLLSYIDEECPFIGRQAEIEKNVNKFSLHYPGPSPTPDRVAASCILHFTSEHFSEIGAAYLAGHIPARLRAQAHYYSVDISEMNHQYRASNENFINSLKCLESSVGPMRDILDDFREFPSSMPEGFVGSIDNFPISSLQGVLDQLHIKSNCNKRTFFGSYASEQLHTLVQFLQVQHIQLFIIEQLAFCARKFGNKTSYSMSKSMMKLWGSEKASAVASIERKYIPATSLLRGHLETCMNDLNVLDGLAAKYHYTLESSFDIRTDPLPAIFSIDDDKRAINLERMNSESFHSLLEGWNIKDMPKPSSPRVNVFKHIMANALLNKVPQILLDEFMTHDRDGLDFCSDWGTGSANSMKILNDAVDEALSQLRFHPVDLGDEI